MHLSQDLEVLYAGGDTGLGRDSIEGDFAKRSVNAFAGIHIIAVGGGGDRSMGDIFVVLFCLHIAFVGTARNRQCTASLHGQQYLLGTADVSGDSGGVAAKDVASGVKFGFSHRVSSVEMYSEGVAGNLGALFAKAESPGAGFADCLCGEEEDEGGTCRRDRSWLVEDDGAARSDQIVSKGSSGVGGVNIEGER